MKISRKIIGLIIIAVLLVAMGFIFSVGDVLDPELEHEITELRDGWNVRSSEINVDNTDLQQLHLDSPAKGDKYVLERVLTEDPVPGACIYFRSLQSMVEVYLNGDLIFTQGLDAYMKGRMPGRTLCYVPLPPDYQGKTISIELTAAEPGAFTNLGPFLLGSQKDLFLSFISDRKLPHLFGTFLSMFALFQFICAPYLIYKNRRMMRQLFSALLVLSIGTYILSFYNIFNLYISDQEVNTFLEFLSIYGIPMSICGFMQYIVRGNASRTYRNLTALNFTLLLFVVILHFMDVIHINRVLMPMYALCMVEVLPFAIYLISRFRKRLKDIRDDWMEELAEILPIIGMMVFATFAFIDMAFFLYYKNVLGDETAATIHFTTVGGMLLAICQMISFLLQGVSFLRSEATKQHLVNMAFFDSLTGLPNRSSCEREMDEKSRSDSPYTVISLDLDALKEVNDNLGHVRGDEMLATFAQELKSVFSDASITGRMGGDEFLVILDDTKDAALVLLDKLTSRLRRRSRIDTQLPYSVSYGMADSSETQLGSRAYDIYLLADQRMYEMKRTRHEENFF